MKNKGLSYLACGCLVLAAFLGRLYLGRSIGAAPVYTIQSPTGTVHSTPTEQTGEASATTVEATADTVPDTSMPDASSAPSPNNSQSTTDTAGGSVNINTADLETLQTLPKIGPKLAQAIIDYRNKNGPFKSIGEITDVPGIGTGIFKLIKDHITVGG